MTDKIGKDILKFMEDANRPFGLNDIFERVGKDYGKTLLQKTLDILVSRKRISEKIYGKQKIYAITQEMVKNESEEMKEYKKLDEESANLLRNITAKETKIRQLQNELKAILLTPTNDEIKNDMEKLESVDRQIELLDKFKNQNYQIVINSDEKKRIETSFIKYEKLYRQRKRLCMDMIDAIMEGYPHTKQQLIEEIGLETDEMVEFDVNVL